MDKIKVLIVEDDISIAELYDKYLPEEIFEKVMIASGEAALKIYRKFTPDLIVLDIILPGMSGQKVLEEIREKCGDNKTAIVMATSISKESYVQECLKHHIQGYILKPFINVELCYDILKCFERMYPEWAGEAIKKTQNRNICQPAYFPDPLIRIKQVTDPAGFHKTVPNLRVRMHLDTVT